MGNREPTDASSGLTTLELFRGHADSDQEKVAMPRRRPSARFAVHGALLIVLVGLVGVADFHTLVGGLASADVTSDELRRNAAAFGSLFVLGTLVGLMFTKKVIAWKTQTDERPVLPPKLCRTVKEKRRQISDVLTHDSIALFSNRLEVRHLMSESVETVPPDATACELKQIMVKNGVHHVPVRGRDQRVIGIVSDRDLRSKPGRTAADLMTRNVVAVPFTTPVADAIDTMLTHNISCLPVLRGEVLCGILTTVDIAVGMQCTLTALEQISKRLGPGDLDSRPTGRDGTSGNGPTPQPASATPSG